MASITQSAATMLAGARGANTLGYGISCGNGAINTYAPTGIHQDGDNFAFCDGHVKWLRKDAVNSTAALSAYWLSER